jgi:hypothetical protein
MRRGGSAGQGLADGDRGDGRGDGRAVTIGAYLALFVLGLVQGLLGTFHYNTGTSPLAAILFDLAILVTCVLGSYGTRSTLGGALPAVGWFIVTVVLSSGNSGGSVLVSDAASGKWFLFGGAICAAGGAVIAAARWSRAARERRAR